MSKIEQYNTEINIFNIPTFLSEKFNCVKTVSPLSPKPQLTSYIVLNNIFKEFASEVTQDPLIRDDLLHHGDTETQNPKEEIWVRMTKNTFLSFKIVIQALNVNKMNIFKENMSSQS